MNTNIVTIKVSSLFLWIILLSAYPSIFSFVLGIPYMLPIIIGFIVTLLLIILHCKYEAIYQLNILFILNFLFWIAQATFRSDYSYISNIFQLIVVFTFYIAVINLTTVYVFAKQYVYLITIIGVVGAISTICIFLFNIPPILSYLAHDGRTAYVFPITATNIYYQLSHPVIRFSGIFDEPGTLAYYSMFALVINKCLIRNKKIEIFLLLAPILTLSIAHYITVFIYSLSFYVKKLSTLFFIFFLIGILFFSLKSLKDTDFDTLYKLTIYRLEKNNDGELHGDNRSDNAINALSYFLKKPIIGYGKTFFENNIGDISFNIFFPGALYGICGYLFIYSIFIWGGIKAIIYKNIIAIKCYLIILLNMFQRPILTNILETSILLLFILSANNFHTKNQSTHVK